MFASNPLLCYVSTIDWQSLLGGRETEVIIFNDPNKFQQKCKKLSASGSSSILYFRLMAFV